MPRVSPATTRQCREVLLQQDLGPGLLRSVWGDTRGSRPRTVELANPQHWVMSATSRQPVGDHQKPFYDRFGRREVLLTTKTSLRPNRRCNHPQPVADQSPTTLQPPCNLPATTRNFSHKEVADRLQAMCDRCLNLSSVERFLVVADRLATGRRLVGDWSPTSCSGCRQSRHSF